jgi:hypothetical protein
MPMIHLRRSRPGMQRTSHSSTRYTFLITLLYLSIPYSSFPIYVVFGHVRAFFPQSTLTCAYLTTVNFTNFSVNRAPSLDSDSIAVVTGSS